MQLNVCADSVSADGNAATKDRVASIGMQLCGVPGGRFSDAFKLAKETMRDLESNNPGIQNLRAFYLTATRDQLIDIGGDTWLNVEKNRSLVDSFEKLLPIEEEERRFEAAVDRPLLDGDGRPVNMDALVAVYASKWTVVELGVSSQTQYGGQNLSQEQRMARRYSVTMNIRMRNDIDVVSIVR
jgi:hypothetical protein